jgi:hypothetical protein
MPIRFSTEAANADKMADDDRASSPQEGLPKAVGADGTPRDKSDRKPEGDSTAGEAKPGKDINAAGFVKDKDAGKP